MYLTKGIHSQIAEMRLQTETQLRLISCLGLKCIREELSAADLLQGRIKKMPLGFKDVAPEGHSLVAGARPRVWCLPGRKGSQL